MFNCLTKRLKKKNRGFTLIEVIVVIGILAILAALAIPAVAGYINNSKSRTNTANGKLIYNAEAAYLASTPTATAILSVSELVTNNYLERVPTTGGGSTSYTIVTDTFPSFHVEWTAEGGETPRYP